MPLSVLLHSLPECLILGLPFLGIPLLLLKDGGNFGGGSGGFRRLVPLVAQRASDSGQSREDGEQDFSVDCF
jgi:hypothetical protein